MSGSDSTRAFLRDVSPELVLVDPELAAIARTLLPEPATGPSRPRTHAAAPRRGARPRVQAPAPDARVKRPTRRVAVVATAVVAACVMALAPASAYRGASTRAPETHASPVNLRAQAARDARAARTYAWSALPGVAGYEIEIFQGERTVYEAVTRVAAVTLPDRLRLSPGRYTLSVTARSAPSLASSTRPLMETTFVVAAS